MRQSVHERYGRYWVPQSTGQNDNYNKYLVSGALMSRSHHNRKCFVKEDAWMQKHLQQKRQQRQWSDTCLCEQTSDGYRSCFSEYERRDCSWCFPTFEDRQNPPCPTKHIETTKQMQRQNKKTQPDICFCQVSEK